MSYTRGSRVPLQAAYTDVGGDPADPTSPAVSILDPSGTVVEGPLVPDRIGLGFYEYPGGSFLVPTDAEAGAWVARWTGIVDGTETGPIDEVFEVVDVVRTVSRGSRIPLEARYTDEAGALVDPTGPTVAILDPDGVELVAALAPVRVSLGVYAYPGGGFVPALTDDLGTWSVQWDGTVAGVPVGPITELFRVVEPDPYGPSSRRYGAGVAGVKDLLPHRTIPAESVLENTVEGFLDDVAARVAVRIEPGLVVLRGLRPDDVRAGQLVDEIEELARFVVELGAAAYTEDAGFPERANLDASDTSYGTVLLARHDAMLADLEKALAGALATFGERGRIGDHVGPDHGFPDDNMAFRTMRW